MFNRKGLLIFPQLLLVAIALLFFNVRAIYAHSPHDIIREIELSPNFDQDKTLFIVISNHLLRSKDEGFSWKELVNGLDSISSISSIAISPFYQVDKTLFVSTNGNGIYKSLNGGASWVKGNNGLDNLNIGLLSISSAHNNQILLAAGSEKGLYKTTDEGEIWTEVVGNDIKITAIAFYPEPMKDHILVGDHKGNLYLSVDSGENWQQCCQISDCGAITSIVISPNVDSDNTFFVGTEKKGVFKTVDNGSFFVEMNNGLPVEANIRSLAISPSYSKDSTVFASTWYKAVFKSNDGGKTWNKYNNGLTTNSQADSHQYKSPHFRDLKISKSFRKDETLFLGGYDGLFKSSDGGRNWRQMETLPLGLIKGLALSSGTKDNLSVAITTYGGGAYISDSQGVTWTISNRGLVTTRLSDIVFSPNFRFDNTIFSASMRRLLKSIDRGKNWRKVSLSETNWRSYLYAVLIKLGIPKSVAIKALSERQKRLVWPTKIALSPKFAADKTLFFATRHDGIFKSEDGGLNNSLVWDGMGQLIPTLVISPDFPSDKTLFVGLRYAGIYKTVDGGVTWLPANNGLKLKDNRISKHIELAISPNYKKDMTVFAASVEGLFKTKDGGGSWHKIDIDDEAHWGSIIGMSISPNYKNDQEIIISVKGRGLFKSNNGGLNFIECAPYLIDNNHSIELIEFSLSYATDRTIYAASDEELFKSTDNASTWGIIKRPVRYENHRDTIQYDGEWQVLKGENFSATRASTSNIAHNTATLNFVGRGIDWIGTTSNDHGIAKVYIDGKHMADIDQYSYTRNFMVRLFSIADMAYGHHTITVEVTDTKNPVSMDYRIEIDAFDVFP